MPYPLPSAGHCVYYTSARGSSYLEKKYDIKSTTCLIFFFGSACRSCPLGCDGGQAGPQRVDYRAVVAAGAEATDGSEPPEDAGHDAGMGTRAT